MNTLLLIGILAIVVIGVGTTIYLTSLPAVNETGNNTTSTTSSPPETMSTRTPGSTPTTSMAGGGVDIEGAWHGTYTGAHGSGRWSFLIWKTGKNTYAGLLRTDGTYSTEGSSIPLTISLEGNEITIGAVAIGVTFTGTVSGDQMSGTWRLVNGFDSGSWNGVRGANDLTPENETITSTYTESETYTYTDTTTSTSFDDLEETLYPDSPWGDIFRDIKSALVSVKEDAKLITVATLPGHSTYAGAFMLKQEITSPITDLNSIVQILQDMGNYTIMIYPTGEESMYYTLLSIVINGDTYAVKLYIIADNMELVHVEITKITT